MFLLLKHLPFNPIYLKMILPNLETERLILRAVLPKDNLTIYNLRSDPEEMKYIPRVLCKSIAEADEMVVEMMKGIEEGNKLNWSVCLKESEDSIGLLGFYKMYPEHFRAEIGYMLLPQYHRQGLMKEAVQAANQFGFTELKLHTIEAVIDPENIASESLLLSLGFVKEAHFKQNVFFEGQFLDSVHYTLFGT